MFHYLTVVFQVLSSNLVELPFLFVCCYFCQADPISSCASQIQRLIFLFVPLFVQVSILASKNEMTVKCYNIIEFLLWSEYLWYRWMLLTIVNHSFVSITAFQWWFSESEWIWNALSLFQCVKLACFYSCSCYSWVDLLLVLQFKM